MGRYQEPMKTRVCIALGLFCAACHANPSVAPETPRTAAVATPEPKPDIPEPAAKTPDSPPELAPILAHILPPPNGNARADVPGCPRLSEEVKTGLARELAATPALATSLEKLDPAPDSVNDGQAKWFEGIQELERARAVFGLVIAICHPYDDVKIASIKAIAGIGQRAPIPFMLEIAGSFAVTEDGSENATLHGILQHELAAALNTLTGANVKLARGQDESGMRKGIPVWTKALASKTP